MSDTRETGPVCFEPRLRGRLAPATERVHEKAVELEKAHIADLGIGESFSMRYLRTKEGLKAILEPKRIEIA